MQVNYYYTGFYNSYKGMTRNIIYIMTEDERLWLADCIKQLIEHRDAMFERGTLERLYTKQGTLKKNGKEHPNLLKTYWVGKDEEAITFLKRLCFFGEYPESVALDPTDYQIESIVNKMLIKIYGRFYGTFSNWLEMETGKELDKSELIDHMNEKRDLYAKMQELKMIPASLELPY